MKRITLISEKNAPYVIIVFFQLHHKLFISLSSRFSFNTVYTDESADE